MNEIITSKVKTKYVMKKPNKALFVGLYIILVLILLFTGATYSVLTEGGESGVVASEVSNSCNVGVAYLEGDMYTYRPGYVYDQNGNEVYYQETYSDVLSDTLRTLDEDESIDMILLRVDSAGGVLAAGEEIALTIAELSKPVVSYVRAQALSSAYYAVSPSEVIVSLPQSEIGGIGVTRSYVSEYRENLEKGRDYIELTSARYKHIGSSVRSLSTQEKSVIQDSLDQSHQIMVEQISGYRNIPIESLESLADGRRHQADFALSQGLIDIVGSYKDVQLALDNLSEGEVIICK